VLGWTFENVYDDDDDEHETQRHLSTSAGSDLAFPVQSGNFRSRLRASDSAPHDWQLSCVDTATVVHHLITTGRRVYAEYHVDGPLPDDLFPVGRYDANGVCLERIFNWTGTVLGPARAQRVASEKLPTVVPPACGPEVERLLFAINATRALYLALNGGAASVVEALKCIRLERLPVHVVSVDCRDVTSAGAPARRSRLNRASTDRRRCADQITRRGWHLHAETMRDFVFVRRRDVSSDHVITNTGGV